jgi:hypothetical protein
MDWNTKITSINTTKGKWKLILITGVLAFVFTNIFEPFGIYNSVDKSEFDIFLEINIAIVGVVASLCFSQFFIRNVFRLASFTYLTIIFWFLVESIIIGIIWTALTLIIDGSSLLFFDLWFSTILEAIFLIGLPYFTSIVYLSSNEKNKTFTHLQDQLNKEKIDPNTLISFKENSHKTKLSLRLGDLFYVESSDNYVLIFYSNGDKLEKRVLRNSIKQLEQELIPYEIIRCHRSYMINPINVSRKEKTTKGLNLFFRKFEEVVVPVSKSYASELENILA